MYNTINMLFDAVVAILTGLFIERYYHSFMDRKIKHMRLGRFVFVAVYFVIDMVLDALFTVEFESVVSVPWILLKLLVVFLLTKMFYNAEIGMTLFLVITLIAVKEICAFISLMVVQWGNGLFKLWIWCMEKGYISFLDTFENMIEITALVLQVLMYTVFVLLFYLSLNSITKNYKEKDYKIRKQELLFLLIPGLVGFLLCVLLRSIMITMVNDVPQVVFDKFPILLVIVPAILALSLLSILYSIKLFQDMILLNRERSNRIILEKQVSNLQEHIEEMEHIYSGVRSMKHDLKNTLSIVMQLALNEENESNSELQSYLSELNQTMDSLEGQFKTGNTVVDTLLNMKYHEAVRTIPDLRMDADGLLFPETLQIHSFDIGIILGNALDNAIEACRKLKEKDRSAETFIWLHSFQKGKMFFLEIENSFDGNVVRKSQSEFPVTDKADKEKHGIGFSNIKNAAEKYHGVVDWTAENKKFTLTVMMQNERRTENEYQ